MVPRVNKNFPPPVADFHQPLLLLIPLFISSLLLIGCSSLSLQPPLLSDATPPKMEVSAVGEEKPSVSNPITSGDEAPLVEDMSPRLDGSVLGFNVALDGGEMSGDAGVDQEEIGAWMLWDGEAIPGYDEEESETTDEDDTLGYDISAVPPPGDGPDFRVSDNEKVQHYMRLFRADRREIFARYLSRSTRYLPMMREIFREHGLPEDLVYMALIESGFSAHAYSHAKAVGPWQFIKSTGERYGLRVDWWIDERKDPVKSTEAAAKYLRDLYNIFGSWDLAMAAYNAGEKKVESAIIKANTRNWWALADTPYLKSETKNYVPQIMAAVIIARDPEKYGFGDVEFAKPWLYDEVALDGSIALGEVAKMAGASPSSIRELNPELLRAFTPPNIKGYKVKVPHGRGERVAATYRDLVKSSRVAWRKHKVRTGETLSGLAKEYGTTVKAIMEANNVTDARRVRAGTNLVIPHVMASVKEDGRAGKDSRVSVDGKVVAEKRGDQLVHVIQRGESLYKIASVYGSSVRAIMDANGLTSSNRIYPGNQLVIPVKSDRDSTRTILLNKPISINEYADRAPSDGRVVNHTVKEGENLSRIADLHKTTVNELIKLNRIKDPHLLKVGEILKVPASSDGRRGDLKMPYREVEVYHTVKSGENLWQIARNYGVSVGDLKSWNGVDGNPLIRPGDKLKLYIQKAN